MPSFRFNLFSSRPQSFLAATGDLEVDFAPVFAAAHNVTAKEVDGLELSAGCSSRLNTLQYFVCKMLRGSFGGGMKCFGQGFLLWRLHFADSTKNLRIFAHAFESAS